ncbi:MAG: sugar transferase [Planctomycetota bacterium]|jgi:exopolysaccharide biosynthesis polyprenyl glycosylphosphotransferase
MEFLKRNFDILYIIVQVWVDGFVTLMACMSAYWVFFHFIDPSVDAEIIDLQLNAYRQLFVMVSGVVLSCFWVFGLYQGQKSILNVEEYRGIFKAIITAFLVTATAVYLLRGSGQSIEETPDTFLYQIFSIPYEVLMVPGAEDFPRVMFLVMFVMIFLFTILERALMFRVLSECYAKGIGNTNVAIFGTGPMAMRLQQKLRLFPTLGYRFIGFVEALGHGKEGNLNGYPILGHEEELDHLRDRYDLRRILIAKPELEEDRLVGLCKKLDNFGIQYQVVPRLYHFFSRRFTVESIDSLPLITPVPLRGRPVYAFVKRMMDILISASILLLTLPITVTVVLLIKKESPGPVFFTQIRQRANNRSFRMVKFRTMFADMCGDAVTPQSSSDPRVTRIGGFLRKTSLDEIPQLWNVLVGHMSIVGPRPEMPFIVERYNETQMLRLDVKPGITGLWQVSEARKAPIHENVDYDLYYIENQSVFLDLTISFLTVATMLRLTSTH